MTNSTIAGWVPKWQAGFYIRPIKVHYKRQIDDTSKSQMTWNKLTPETLIYFAPSWAIQFLITIIFINNWSCLKWSDTKKVPMVVCAVFFYFAQFLGIRPTFHYLVATYILSHTLIPSNVSNNSCNKITHVSSRSDSLIIRFLHYKYSQICISIFFLGGCGSCIKYILLF